MASTKTEEAAALESVQEPAIHLLQTQKDYLQDKARFKSGMFTRQGGKTFVGTLEVVDDVYEAEARRRRSPWVILSRSQRQSEIAMREGVFRHAKAYGIALKSLAHEEIEFYDEDNIKRKAFELIFPRGNFIVAVPASPDTVRGYSANMLFDEFAIHKNSREIWAAAFPIINRGYKARAISSPKGKNNKFYEIMTDKDGVWSRHIMNIYQAIAQGAPLDAVALKKALRDDDAWMQEYELEWLDDASSWLDYDLINSVENDHAGIPANYEGGPCFVGVDIARRSDNFVIWVDELVGDVLWNREMIVKKRISFAEMDRLQDDVDRRYRVVRHCMDQTGMGEKPVEDAKHRYGENRVEGVLLTNTNKQHLANLIKQNLQDRKSRIPMGDDDLRADFHAVRKLITPTGAPRFDADSDANGHADRFWAKSLACLAASGGQEKYEYTPASNSASRWDGPGRDDDEGHYASASGGW